MDNDEDKVIVLTIVTSSTVLAPLGPLPIKATGARRPPAAPGARGSTQRELEDDVKRKRWTGAERPMNLDISFMAELFGRSGRGEIGSVKLALCLGNTSRRDLHAYAHQCDCSHGVTL